VLDISKSYFETSSTSQTRINAQAGCTYALNIYRNDPHTMDHQYSGNFPHNPSAYKSAWGVQEKAPCDPSVLGNASLAMGPGARLHSSI
jgi:hypothetical protein